MASIAAVLKKVLCMLNGVYEFINGHIGLFDHQLRFFIVWFSLNQLLMDEVRQ
jgi:hypothetical protein